MLKPGSHVHLIGACGTAMATLAAMLAERGHRVRGSDQDPYPPMSDLLAERGIPLATPYAAGHLDPEPDLVVVGNAISRGNVELEAVLDRGLPYRSMAEVLRDEFLQGRHVVVIAGTHGKTTTTAMTGLALLRAGLDPSIVVGGYVEDLRGSYRLGAGAAFVVEGDEYDTAFFDKTPKFLKYLPRTLVVNNVEFDHADIYEDLESIELQFRRLVHLVPRTGLVLVGDDSEAAARVVAASLAPVQRFGLAAGSHWRATELEHGADGTSFGVLRADRPLGRVSLATWGEHAVRNALAAVAVAVSLGGRFEDAAAGLAAMRPIRRRLELRGEVRGVAVHDDFAHHPTAIRETLRAARARHPGRRLWAVFEPRSATCRRNVHQATLGPALAHADLVVLTEPWRAEALAPAERLDAAQVCRDVERLGRRAWVVPDAAGVAERVGEEARPGDVVVIMSNGAFGGVHEMLLARLAAASAGAAS